MHHALSDEINKPQAKKNRHCAGFLQRDKSRQNVNKLFELVRNELGHLKHRDLSFTENRAQIGVGVDHATIDGVLQAVFLDVIPHLLGNFRARQWHGTDHRSEDR